MRTPRLSDARPSRPTEAITAFQLAGAAYLDVGDRHSESLALQKAAHFHEWIAAVHPAGDTFPYLGDRHSEKSLDDIVAVLDTVGLLEGLSTAHEAVQTYLGVDDPHSEGQGMYHLGEALKAEKRFTEAIAALQRAGDIFRDIGDRHGQDRALDNLRKVLRTTDETPRSG